MQLGMKDFASLENYPVYLGVWGFFFLSVVKERHYIVYLVMGAGYCAAFCFVTFHTEI